MQKKVIVEKMRDQSNRLKHLLTEFSSSANHTVSEIEAMLKETEQLTRILSAYRFLAEPKGISNDIDVHLKIMDAVSKQEEAKAEIKEQVKPIEPAVKPVEIREHKTEIKPEEKIQEKEPDVTGPENKNGVSLKKIEFGINDKYRIINELFNHNMVEYATAVNQLNMTGSWEDAEDYLDSLKNVYNWKNDLPLVKILYATSQKRFQ